MTDHQMTLDEIPHSHRDDPITSYEAGDKMIESGKLTEQENLVLYAINHYYAGNDFTARELSKYNGLDYYLIQRRLSGLHRKGKIEHTGEKRGGCMVWRLKDTNSYNKMKQSQRQGIGDYE